jgi:hypothetical protein
MFNDTVEERAVETEREGGREAAEIGGEAEEALDGEVDDVKRDGRGAGGREAGGASATDRTGEWESFSTGGGHSAARELGFLAVC